MNNKSAIGQRLIQTMDRLNIVNDALLKSESDGDVELAMRAFAGFVLRACYVPRSELVLGNSSTKLSCLRDFHRVAYGRR